VEWPEDLLRARFEYELELAPAALCPELLAELSRLEPHGQGNPQPLLRVGPLALAGEPRIFGRSARKHVAAAVAGPDGSTVEVLGWGWGGRLDQLAGTFEALGHLEADRYTGRPVLRLVDTRHPDSR